MYKLIRTILFLFDPEKIHHFAVCYLKFLFKIPIISNIIKSNLEINDRRLEREVFGLKFKNPVGLAAGFDKDAKLFKELSNLGFGNLNLEILKKGYLDLWKTLELSIEWALTMKE